MLPPLATPRNAHETLLPPEGNCLEIGGNLPLDLVRHMDFKVADLRR